MALAYAPSLETTPVRIAATYDHFIGGRWVPSSSGGRSQRSTRRPRTNWRTSPSARAEDVDRAVAAARDAYERVWRPMRPADRAKYLYRIARAITERSRELAVLETKDGGKPIKESRDFDVVQAAAHFFYYAGWADKLHYAIQRRQRPGAGRRRRLDRALELPAADGGVEDRAGARLRQHRRAQAGRDDAADRAAARADLRRGRAAAGRRQHRDRRRRDRRGAGRASRASTRSRSPARPKSARSSEDASPARAST